MKNVHLLTKENILSAIDKINNTVVASLGPYGSNTIISNIYPTVTKDGITITKSIGSTNPVENTIIQLIGESSLAVSNMVGDGTTSASAIACSTIKYYIDNDKWPLPGKDRNNIEHIIADIEKMVLENDVIRPNSSIYRNIAYISSNSDDEITNISLEAFRKAGKNGLTYVDYSENDKSYVSETNGFRLSKGLLHAGFIHDLKNFVSIIDEPVVIVGTKPIDSIDSILPIFRIASEQKRAVVIFSNSVAIDVLTAMIENMRRGGIKCAVIGIPGTGSTVEDIAQDIAYVANVPNVSHTMSTSYSDSFMKNKDQYMNSNIKKIFANMYSATLVYKDTSKCYERSKALLAEMKHVDDKSHKEELRYRSSAIIGKIVTIKIGANTNIAKQEKIDRVDDTLHALQSVRQYGAVLGGGLTLRKYAYMFPPISIISDIIMSNLQINDIATYTDYIQKNSVFDPAMSIIHAMKSGVSAALNILSSRSIVINISDNGDNR